MKGPQTTFSRNEKPTITIVGGGMVGISLALLLAAEDADWQIVLMESLPFPASVSFNSRQLPVFQPGFDSRSTAISTGSLPLLQRIDCWETLQQHAAAIKQVQVSDRGYYAGNVFDAAQLQQEQLGVVIENSWLGNVLFHQLMQRQDKICCLAPASVTQLQPVAQGVELTMEQDGNTQTHFADLVIIADGEHSSLRRSLGIEVNTHNYHQAAVITNIALSQPHKGVAYEHFTGSGPLALLPLTDCNHQHRAALVWTHHEEQLQTVLSWDDQTFIHHLQQQVGYRAGKIIGVGKREGYPLQLMQATEQVRSNMVIMGNAAHCVHPVAGQGFNLSLRDCATLADVLAGAYKKGKFIGDYKTLADYEQRRSLDQQLTVSLTHQLVKQFSSQQLPRVLLRQLGLLTLNAMPAMHQHFAKQLMGQQAYQ